MDAVINNVIYMELNSGPKIANSTCGKTIDVETIDRDSTVYPQRFQAPFGEELDSVSWKKPRSPHP